MQRKAFSPKAKLISPLWNTPANNTIANCSPAGNGFPQKKNSRYMSPLNNTVIDPIITESWKQRFKIVWIRLYNLIYS